ncbi:MAG: hypothetical protein IPP17_23880 [Bacteroidetes bacterium]|nr:hypothetical protein [Bacteroidota bacterium]
MENLEETIVRTKRTLTFMVKHPIDFMAGLFQAVGMGFTQFGDNIQKHLVSGLVMWLTGGMREEPIRLPDKWDLKGILFFIMEVLGLGWANLRKKLVKHVGEQAMGLAEKGLDIVMKLFTEGPIAMWEDIRNQGEELKGEIFAAVREMMIIEIIKQGVIFLLSLTNPASGIVKAIKAIYDFVMWFFNNIHRIIEMVKKVFEASANIVEGNLGGAANAIERIMGLTIPVIIDLFLSILGLSGLPKKIMGVIKRVGGKLNALIDKLLLKVVGVIKKMFGKGKKGGGKKKVKEDPKKDDKNKLTAADKRKHEKYVNEIDKALNKKPEQQPESYEDFHKQEEKKAKTLISKYNSKLTKKVNGKPIRTFIKFTPVGSDKADKDVDYEIEIKPNTTSLKGSAKFGDPPIPASPNISPAFGTGQFHSLRLSNWHKSNHPAGSPASQYGGDLHGADAVLRTLGVRSKWVAFHVFNEHIGGKAMDSNLIPTPADDNKSYLRELETRLKNLHKKDHVIWFEAQASYRSDGMFVQSYSAKGAKMEYKNNNWEQDKKGIKTWDATIREPEARVLKLNLLPNLSRVAPILFKKVVADSSLWESLIPKLEPGMPFRNKQEVLDFIDNLRGIPVRTKTTWSNQISSAQLSFD